MAPELAHYIREYGYVSIFLLIFLQEIGVPNPVTNEFVLLFSGYLAFAGVLRLWLVIPTAVGADFIGTTFLYAVFYCFGAWIARRHSKWIPARLERAVKKISERRRWPIYVARHVPFLRGYISVAAGLMPLSPRIFIPAVILSAFTWSGGYVIAGWLLGPYWERVAKSIGGVETAVLMAVLIAAATLIARALLRRKRQTA